MRSLGISGIDGCNGTDGLPGLNGLQGAKFLFCLENFRAFLTND